MLANEAASSTASLHANANAQQKSGTPRHRSQLHEQLLATDSASMRAWCVISSSLHCPGTTSQGVTQPSSELMGTCREEGVCNIGKGQKYATGEGSADVGAKDQGRRGQ